MSTELDLSLSFLLFFGGLASICALLLYKSIRISRRGDHYALIQNRNALYSWHTPNLKRWKGYFYSLLYWIRDISFRYWAVHVLSYIKLCIYKLLRAIHKQLLGTIKYLEKHEDQLKERLADQSVQRSATEERLIRTLSRKRYQAIPANTDRNTL